MERGRQWRIPYRDLFKQMMPVWAEGVYDDRPEELKGLRPPGSPGIFYYPLFAGTLDDFPFTVELCEYPSFKPGFFPAVEHVEYLRLHVTEPLDYTLEVRFEGLFDDVLKATGIYSEFKTGNPQFDSKYFLEVISELDKRLVRDPGFQELIYVLEPFAVVALTSSGIHWSQEVRDASQLSLAAVEHDLKRIFELSRFIERKKKS